MNKLKEKVLVTLLIVLSIINICFLVFFNANIYTNIRNEVKNTLLSKSGPGERMFEPFKLEIVEHGNKIEILKNDDVRFTKEKFNDIEKRYNSKKDFPKLQIGNLYFDNYSYIIKNNGVYVVDVKPVGKLLRRNLMGTFALFCIFEVLIVFACKILTNWIVNPVKQTFDNQNEFIEDASHELKTPLAVIVASIDAYEKDKSEKWINNIKNESNRMSELIKDLLDLSQLENDIKSKDDNKSIIDLSNLIESQLLTCESLFYEYDIKLEYDIEKDITCFCNEGQVKQLIHILIDNAIKHSNKDCDDKNKKVNVLLSKDANQKNILLEVSNKGKTLSKEECERIFERFYKKDKSRNREDNNYGLGLAIAKSICMNNNAMISCESRNDYITFKVLFNVKK